jgi:chromosome segregation ATPase
MAVETPVWVALVGALSALAGGLVGRRTAKDTHEVNQFQAISDAEARMRIDMTKEIARISKAAEECHQKHAECEEANRELTRRVDDLDTRLARHERSVS